MKNGVLAQITELETLSFRELKARREPSSMRTISVAARVSLGYLSASVTS